MWVAMVPDRRVDVALSEHRLRNGVAVAVIVLLPSVLLILLGLARPPG
jgi:hypothetical protein